MQVPLFLILNNILEGSFRTNLLLLFENNKKIINARKLLKKNSKPLKSVRCFRGIPLRSPINGISYVSIFRDLEILPVARFTDIRRSKQLPILDRGIGKTLQTCGMSVKTKHNILYGQNLLHY